MKKKKISSEEADGANLYKKLRKHLHNQIAVELPSGAVAHVSPNASPELINTLDRMAKLAAEAFK